MSDEKRVLTAKALSGLIDTLIGTCKTLEEGLEGIGFEIDELDQGDFTAIDAAIFCCNSCGWWCSQDENVAEDGEEWLCQDCKDKE